MSKICMLMQIAGLVLIILFRTEKNVWLGVGCGLFIAAFAMWMMMHPANDEEDDE